jgi:phosphohistidine phosphatase
MFAEHAHIDPYARFVIAKSVLKGQCAQSIGPIMRRLILLRHSTAEKAGAGESDRDRVLSAKGHSDAAMVGSYFANHSFRPDHVLVSPAARTRETWHQVAAALRAPPEAKFDERIYNAASQTLFSVAAKAPDEAHALLILGHNPGLHELAVMLTATGDIDIRERLRENFPTSGIAIIDFAFDSWAKLHPRAGRLEQFVSPKLIAGITN